ncbi:MAG: hypothetical protein RR410_08885 [Alistipes sp.]
MKKYLIILAAALAVCAFSGCEEKTKFPYIPVEKPDDSTPPTGADPATYSVTYKIDKVLQSTPDNTGGIDIANKFDFFGSVRMTLNVSPTATTLSYTNGEIPFYPFDELLPEGTIACDLDTSTTPNVLRLKDSQVVFATFESDGFTISFHLDCKSITYKYKLKSIN